MTINCLGAWPKVTGFLTHLKGSDIMCRTLHHLTCFALAMILAGAIQGAALAPDDASIQDSLCLWLRSPDVNYNADSGVWADLSGRGHDAVAMGMIDAWGVFYDAPTLAFGSNPTVFNHAFGTAKFSGDIDDLMRAANINDGAGLAELTIIAVYKLYNQDQSGAGMTRPVGIGSFIGEGANLGDYFNLGNDMSIRKDNGSIQGATAEHPDDTFFIRIGRMNPSSVDQWINITGTLEHIHNATGVSYTTSVDNFYLGDLRADSTTGQGTSGYSTSDIEIAEVVVYNTDLTEAQLEGISEWLQANLRMERKTAFGPQPENGAIVNQTWAVLGWEPGISAASHNVYIGDDFDRVNEATTDDADLFAGNTASTMLTIGFPGFPIPDGLVPGTTYYWRVDEVNDAEPDSPWKGEIWNFSIPPKTAYNPNPTDGAEFVDPNTVTLSWTPGYGAVLHTVYLGDDFDEVNNATGGAPLGSASYKPGPLELENVYYWRVDEFDAVETHKGLVWSFTTPGAVGNPQPANGATDVQLNAALSWTPADSAASHQLYLGLDKETVRTADTSSTEYKGSITLGSENYDPGLLETDTTYSWRVDEVDGQNNTAKGPIWTFTTGAFLLVDDFENYTDDDPNNEAIWQTWIDGFGIADNGAQVGYLMPPYAEQTIVHGGGQSMPLLYVNEAGVTNSEATLTLTAPRDWTEGDVGELALWFRGDTGNAAEPLYVAISNSAGSAAIVAHEDPGAATVRSWTQWRIPLQAFADQGIDLTNVDKIAIGLGTKAGPAAGGSGTMYIDDIRLYRMEP
jgi:hypothetical protein